MAGMNIGFYEKKYIKLYSSLIIKFLPGVWTLALVAVERGRLSPKTGRSPDLARNVISLTLLYIKAPAHLYIS